MRPINFTSGLVLVTLASSLVICVTLSEESHYEGVSKKQTRSAHPMSYKEANDYDDNQDDMDNRILLTEPYKTLIQSSARFALSQTEVSKLVDLDTAMDLISDVGFMLSNPATLIKAVKAVTVVLATMFASAFLFPGAYKFFDAAYRDPVNTLNLDKYFSNGVNEKSVLAVIGSKTDETLNMVGLKDTSCRERSFCYMGEILKCSFPQTAERITKFVSEKFSNLAIKDNVLVRSFVSGFVDRNCSSIANQGRDAQTSCLGNFINKILVSQLSERAKRYP